MGKDGYAQWCWCIISLLMLPMARSMEVETKDCEQLEDFSTLTYDLTSGLKCYPRFLTRLRNQVEAPTMVCGVKSTRTKPLKGREFVLLNLKFSNTEWVTLGVSSENLYVWGYQDNVKYNGKYRASFLEEVPNEAKDNLFQGATKRITSISASYTRLEYSAQVSRLELTLGIPNLEHSIRSVYGRSEIELEAAKSDEAKFFLIAAQMVAEAARFKFMEQAIVEGDASTKTKLKMLDFQNDWKIISNAFHAAEDAKPKCIVFTPDLKVGNTLYHNVEEIKDDMGILLHKTIKKSP